MNVKVGQTVVVAASGGLEERKVLSVGRKWITVEGRYAEKSNRWALDCREGDPDQDIVSYGSRYQLFSSREAYDTYNKLSEARKALRKLCYDVSVVLDYLRDDLTAEQISAVTEQLRSLTKGGNHAKTS